MKLILLIMFSLCLAANDQIFNSSLNIWTEIDLVRAINSDNKYKKISLSRISDQLLDIYFDYRTKKSPEKNLQLTDLFNQINENFMEVFENSKHEEYHVSCYLIKNIINLLK